MTLLMIVPSLVCLAAAAAAALLYALRGRRGDDHPICRRCGFDLFGKPETSTVCSECGADLGRRRAVRVGRRERRGRLAAVAVPVLVACLAFLSFVGWRAARDTNWNRHKPAWWLMWEAGGSRLAQRDAAFAELADRMTSGKLTPQQEGALVDAALELQADRRRPWTAAVGDVIATAADAGKLSNEKWHRYAWQAAPMELVARPVVRRGDPVVFAMVIPPSRLATAHMFIFRYEITQARVGDVVGPMRAPDGTLRAHGGEILVPGGGAAQATYEMPEAGNTLAALREGPHTLRVSARLEMDDWSSPRRPRNPPMQFGQTCEFSTQVKVVPKDDVTVGIVSDPSLRPAVAKSITAGFTQANEDGYCNVVVEADKPPIDLAYTVIARHGQREWQVGFAQFKAGQSDRATGMLKLLTGLPGIAPDVSGGMPAPARFELVLRPSVEQAVRTPDITRIWGGELIFKDVSVDRAAAAPGGFRCLDSAGPGTAPPTLTRPSP